MLTKSIIAVPKEALPFVSVIIPTYRDWERLRMCLSALTKQTYPKESFEILVINNDPEDDIPQDFTIPNNCRLLEEVESSSYAARNKGISLAKGKVYAFTDADCIPRNDWLETAIKFFSENPDFDRIGGLISLYPKYKKMTWAETYDIAFEMKQDVVVSSINAAMTANMITKSKVFKHVGGFDSKLKSLGDAEWGKKAEAKGFKIAYLSECVVDHPARHTVRELVLKTRRMAGGYFLLNESNRKNLLKEIIRGFFPPIHAFRNNKGLKGIYKIVFILYFLKIVRSLEIINLLLGKRLIRN